MKLFSQKKGKENTSVQTAPARRLKTPLMSCWDAKGHAERRLYRELRLAVPVVDAALSKLVRLIGTFEVKAGDKTAQKPLERYLAGVRVGATGVGVHEFIYTYFDQLLTYGTAVGELVSSADGRPQALYNAPLSAVELRMGGYPQRPDVYTYDENGVPIKAPHPERILISALSPEPGELYGRSLLSGLPFVSTVLMTIFGAMQQNFDRAGNVRFAVTYNPPQGAAYSSKQKAQEIAREWSRAMRDAPGTSDFIAVGDVSIKAIGADGQILDYDVPVRHILEQIVSKLSIPPFLLGLSWSSTERMSAQQADIMTSELEYYRTILNPVIERIACAFLRSEGYSDSVVIDWNCINLQDETELASARLMNAQAAQIEREIGTEVKE